MALCDLKGPIGANGESLKGVTPFLLESPACKGGGGLSELHLMTFHFLNSMPGRCAQSAASFPSLASCGLEKQDILVVMATGWLGCDRAAFEVIHCLRETEEVEEKQWPAGRGHGG